MKQNHSLQNIVTVFIIYLFIIGLNCFRYFKIYPLLSNKFILITDEGIIKYDSQLDTTRTLLELNDIINSNSNEEFLSFTKSTSEEGGFFFCRINNNIYVFDESDTYIGNFMIEPTNVYCVLNPYRTADGINTIIVSYINGDQNLKVLMYKIDSNQENMGTLICYNEKKALNNIGQEGSVLNKGISCQLIYSSYYTNKLLTCFIVDQISFSLNAIVFNPEDSLDFIQYSDNVKSTSGTSYISSVLTITKKKSIICMIDNSQNLICSSYDSENNLFSDFTILINGCQIFQYNMDVIHISQEQGYISFCIKTSSIMHFTRFDENFNIKDGNTDNDKCYSSFQITGTDCFTIFSSHLLYDKYNNNYIVFRTCFSDSDPNFYPLIIDPICNEKIEIPHSKTTVLSTQITTLISSTSFKKSTTFIKTTLISSTSIMKSSTYNKKTLMSSSNIKTTALSLIPSTFIKKSNISKSTSLSSMTLTPTTSTINNNLSKSTLIEKEGKYSSLTKSSSLFTDTTISKKKMPLSLLSSIQSKISPSTQIFESSTSSPLNSTSPLIPKLSTFISNLSNPITTTTATSSSPDGNYLFEIIFNDGNIIKGKIDKTKEELENSLDMLINITENGKKYLIYGKDYNITITPINDLNTFKSTYVDFTLCEGILRKEYNISLDELLTILQIEIDKMNEKALTSQVEYAIYDEKKQKLNLSYCKDIEIKVNYEIKDQSVLNKTMIKYYSELGVDIFDSEDSFFNDLCYSFSISNSDVILKDRVSDIYQNYSLCDNGCNYDTIDIENMTVSCTCKVKKEISLDVTEPALSEMVQDTFKNSNFGVIRCYNLVFDFSNKSNNIGFFVFLFFVLVHIVCYILYFIKGIKPIIIFVYKEMEKNKYISRGLAPKKKEKTKKKEDNNSSINNNLDSAIVLNKKNITKNFHSNKYKESQQQLKVEKKKKNKKMRNNNPIFIFNYKYDNNYYKINNGNNRSPNSSIKILTPAKERPNKTINDNKYNDKKEEIRLNKEKKWPGYYNLILINANNSLKNKPPSSKYILNNYNYKEAIKYDERDFWRIFYICILHKEIIINTFFFSSPLEIQNLRLSLFIFTFSCDFALNALFYLNENISEKYHYKGESLYLFILINNLTITAFSTIISYLIVKFLNCLTNSQDSIEQLFRNEEKKMRKNREYKVSRKKKNIIYSNLLKIYKFLKIKIVLYIIIEFSIMLFFFYFITAFCEVYT